MTTPAAIARDVPTHGEAGALAQVLAEAGLPCRVEASGRLAVLTTHDPAPLADPATRRRVAALAAARGFTHVALELDPDTERT